MDNNNASPVSQAPSHAPTTEQTVSNGSAEDKEEVITELMLAGLKVLMVKKRDQIIYKLPDNMQVSDIKEEQRQQLMKEIQNIHQAQMMAAAPKNELDTPPQPATAAEADAIKETARKLREELEQQQRQQMYSYDSTSNPSSPQSAGGTTRRYNKTGKYSKKKQQQQLQQQLHQQFNQQYMYNPQQKQQFMALQQSLSESVTPTTPMSAAGTSSANTPMNTAFPFPMPVVQQQQLPQASASPSAVSTPSAPTTQQQQQVIRPPAPMPQADSILSKRLPEEEIQHREVKKRCLESLISDQKAVTSPDYETPFSSLKDAMDRLLSFHIYQYPKKDLDANKIPLDRQDHTMIEIFKCQTDLFEKHALISKKIEKNTAANVSLKILVERQVVAELRQKLTEEQARVAAEQATQQHQEMLRAQTEKARVAAEQAAARQQQLLQQQQQQQQQMQQQQQQQQLQQQMQQMIQQQQMAQAQQQQPQDQQRQMQYNISPATNLQSPQQQQQMLMQQQLLQQLLPQQMQQLIQQQQMAQQAQAQQAQQQQQNTSAAPANNNATAFANGLAQAQALLSNPQFANQYSQLSPELQQRLSANREQLVALIEKQRQQNNMGSSNNNQ